MQRIVIFICLLLISYILFANKQSKQYITTRIEKAPVIDGILNDEAWKISNAASDFIQCVPNEGENPNFKTEFRIIYDNNAIYIGVMLYDNHPDSILRELGNRDDLDLNADLLRVLIDPYNMRQDAYEFAVWASGIQYDRKVSDATYDAVWESAVNINDKGWSAELKLPYSSFRFPKKTEQIWGFQITRNIRRTREFDQWALTPANNPLPLKFWGELTGISNVEPPIRLSFTPYFSSYFEQKPEKDDITKKYTYNNSLSYNLGADLKYGIDERFTLDVTLMPDFGQVQSDNKVKNLSYQEVMYSENRPFFKESTELFQKGNLFYTRRIGKKPSGFDDIDDSLEVNGKIIDNPSQVKLLNATKLSGRNDDGLGIGFFNAITDDTYATIENAQGQKRKILTEPLSNFNVLVFDQQLQNNSSVYFINTNVIRDKKYSDANVSLAGFNIIDKNNIIQAEGYYGLSQKYKYSSIDKNTFENKIGYKYYAGLHKISGIYNFGVTRSVINNTYTQSDLGYYTTKDYINHVVYFRYNQNKPFGRLMYFYNNNQINYTTNYTTKKITNLLLETSSNTTFKNYFSLWGGFGINPLVTYDYNEPRQDGRYQKTWRVFYGWFGFSSDYRKRIAIDYNLSVSNFIDKYISEGFNNDISIRLRVNDKFTLRYGYNIGFDPYNLGYVDNISDSIYFGLRKLTTHINTISAKFIIKKDMSFSLNMRHYWNTAIYRKYLYLEQDGNLIDNETYTKNNDFNYNNFTVDFVYSWIFSPGSTLSVVYKNAIESEIQNTKVKFGDNFMNTIKDPQLNSISIKFLYYLDYIYLKRAFRKK